MVVRVVTRRTAAPPAGTWPLTVSGDGRRVLTAAGASWQGNGDTPWSLIVQTDATSLATYLDDRQAKGVNAVLCNLLEHQYSSQSPAWENQAEDAPFGSTVDGSHLDFTDPNEAYWAWVDTVLEACRARGITVFCTPAYLGFGHGGEGWAAEVNANGVERMATYGAWLGARYADQPNLVWVMGGDAAADLSGSGGYDLTAHENALAAALAAADGAKLFTAHSGRTLSSVDSYDQAWLNLNASYATNAADVYSEVDASWQQVAKPTFLIEANYYTGNDQAQRQQAYVALLGGGVAHFMGIEGLWQMSTGWESLLDSYGSTSLPYIARLQAARDLPSLTPDPDRTVVTAGWDYPAVRASSEQLVAYTVGSSLTVDRSQFTAGTYRVRWYDPATGETTSEADATMGSGSQTFAPPSGGERVLLLDLASLGLGAP